MPARRLASGEIEFLGSRHIGQLATLQIPCGQCAECRLKRSREWAIRCVHESSLHADNCFITLTYRDNDRAVSLNYRDFQLFMKRLRKQFPRDRIGFFCCGEYGETNPATRCKDGGKYRAHFHAILFNFNFPDRQPCRLLSDTKLENSALLDRLWGYGDCKIGAVTFESASYVARYAMKKVNGDLQQQTYELVTNDGEIINRTPEMLCMSKRPAIGRRWFEKHGKQVYAFDAVISRGHEMQPPRYYDKLLPPVVLQLVQQQRIIDGSAHAADHTIERDKVRDTVIRAGLSQKLRS
ncbi:MAG: replication initiator protein [Microvirus sp.]|nr:MAG: replication initiator protein [Microvirus sp.]